RAAAPAHTATLRAFLALISTPSVETVFTACMAAANRCDNDTRERRLIGAFPQVPPRRSDPL
ncbi:MAG TPA: hypothetical protein VIH96_15210, partial [Paraburkholderia sp.]